MIPDGICTEYPPCPNGCASDDVALFTAQDRLNGLPGEFQVVRCRHCGLIRTAPRPTAASIGHYYPESYSPYATTEVTGERTPRKRGLLFRIARAVSKRLVELNTEVTPDIPKGRMLEIGCASGSFLAHMAAQGWAVEGIEFGESAAAKARAAGFRVQVSSIESAVDPDEPFDLVVGWMVVEHLHDPVAALTKLASWVAPGAWLAISTPNAASLDFRLFRRAGYALQVPTHLYHFSPTTLSALLARSGWSVERVYHQRILGNYLGSIGLLLEDLNAPRSLSEFFKNLPARRGYLNHALYPLAWLLSHFGQTGRITVWARRRAIEPHK